jgi:hypothetical protein
LLSHLFSKSCHRRPTSGPRSANKLSWPNELATACHSAVGFASGSLCPSAARVGAARARRHLRKPSRQTAAAALLPASCCLEFVELREPSFGERRTHHAAPPLTTREDRRTKPAGVVAHVEEAPGEGAQATAAAAAAAAAAPCCLSALGKAARCCRQCVLRRCAHFSG